MNTRPVSWSPSAVDLVMAMRQRQEPNETISNGAAIYAWTQLLPPGASALSRALRDEQVWPNYVMFLQAAIDRRPVVGAAMIFRSLLRWEWESEQRARNDASYRVGERHILDQIGEAELSELGINVKLLRSTVREFELGPAMSDAMRTWRHALLDLSALIEYRRPDEIPWPDVMGGSPVMLWLVGSVLNELDDAKRSDRRRARKRAHNRSSWIWQLLDEALGETGIEIRKDGTRLKAWVPPTAGLRDTDHLEAALNLRALGLDLVMVSDDINMAARARLAGLNVVRLDSWRLPDEGDSST